MDQAAFALFPTAIGRCGIAWRGDTVVATHLPEPDEALAADRLARRAGGARAAEPPAAIARAIAAVTALLDEGRADLDFIRLDTARLPAFEAAVYARTRAIPPGETLTYGAIAAALGDKRQAQAVGQALGRNPFPIIVPCHRVMGANGRLTGFSAEGGVSTKLKMLAIEGARIGEAPGLFGALPLAVRGG